LMVDFVALLAITPSGGQVSAYGESFKAVAKPVRPAVQNLGHAAHVVEVIETPILQSTKSVRNAATDLTSKAAVITSDTDISHLPPLRQQYIREVMQLEDVKLAMQASGMGEEATARALHQMRREIGIKYKDLTPKDYLENVIYPRNHDKYGDVLGPTFDWLREKGKTLQQIIEGALRPDGKDLGLGL